MFCAIGLCVSLDVTRSFLCNQFISSSNCPLNLFPDHPDILQLLTTWACVLVRRSWVESRNKFKSVQQPLENAMLTWNCERKHVGREISECLFPSRSRAWYWHLKKKGAAVLVHSYRFVLKVGEIFYCDAYGPWKKKVWCTVITSSHLQLASRKPKATQPICRRSTHTLINKLFLKQFDKYY